LADQIHLSPFLPTYKGQLSSSFASSFLSITQAFIKRTTSLGSLQSKMQPSNFGLDNSNKQIFRDPTPAEIHVPVGASPLPSEDDRAFGGNPGNSTPEYNRVQETALDILCRAAISGPTRNIIKGKSALTHTLT
jgi:hypothetical protein